MKKVLIFYGLLVVAIVIFALSRGYTFFHFGTSSSTAKINGKTYQLILAKTSAEKIKGLSGRTSLDKNAGMLFIFATSDKYAFWMNNMKFPIDIIWINNNKIVDFVENAPAPSAGQNASMLPIYKPSDLANYVLEVNAHEVTSLKMKKGDTVVFTNAK